MYNKLMFNNSAFKMAETNNCEKNPNSLMDHIKELNKQEQLIHEQRRIKAIDRIRELRRAAREQAELKHD